MSGITEENNEEMKSTFSLVSELKDKYEDMVYESRMQLLTSQLQFFQSLTSILLAFQGILFIFKDNFNIVNEYFYTSALLSILLTLYISSYIRETIDAHDKSLTELEVSARDGYQNLIKAINESRSNNNPLPFKEYVQGIMDQKIDRKQEVLFSGEISIFLFSNSLLFGLASLTGYYTRWTFIAVLLICIFITFSKWAYKVTKITSHLLLKFGVKY